LIISSEASGSTPRVSYKIFGLAVSTLSWMSPISRLLRLLSCGTGGASVRTEVRDIMSGTPCVEELADATSALRSVLLWISCDGSATGSAFSLFVGADLAALDFFTAFNLSLSSARTKFRFSMMWSPRMISSWSSFIIARSSAFGCLISSRSRS